MTLERSLHSNAGLPLSPTDSPATPEERIAARLINRLGLVPRIDVAKIASSLATVTEKRFPYQIDGVSLDLKVIGKRPKIWVSRDNGHVRRRFTLAHEIGHILIPWHTGGIIDDLDEPRSRGRGQYRQMEAEANRFAAELLMPTAWVKGLRVPSRFRQRRSPPTNPSRSHSSKKQGLGMDTIQSRKHRC